MSRIDDAGIVIALLESIANTLSDIKERLDPPSDGPRVTDDQAQERITARRVLGK